MASSLDVYPSLSGIAGSEIFTGYPLTMKQSSKKIALIAHDKKKSELLAWVLANKEELATHELIATGTTGKLIAKESGLPVQLVESGPYGGDIQIGAEMVENRIHALIFFWDPLEPQPHDPDVKALLRVSVLKNIPTASNRATADLLIHSKFFN